MGWELKKIVDLSHAEKLIVVFPQVRKPFWKRDESAERLAMLDQAFAGTRWEPGLAKLAALKQAKRMRSIMFLQSSEVVAVTARPKNRESYHLAALISHYLQRQDRGEMVALPAESKSGQ